jgi:hypothetical protein
MNFIGQLSAKISSYFAALQIDLDEYIKRYNLERAHQGKRFLGKIPMQTILEGKGHFLENN